MNRLLNIQSKRFKGRHQEGSIIPELPQTTLQKYVLYVSVTYSIL